MPGYPDGEGENLAAKRTLELGEKPFERLDVKVLGLIRLVRDVDPQGSHTELCVHAAQRPDHWREVVILQTEEVLEGGQAVLVGGGCAL